MSELRKQILDLLIAGVNHKAIVRKIGCGLTTVKRVAKTNNIRSSFSGVRDYTINSDVFDIIDTEQKAYWLGFLLADGCIAKSAGTRRTLKVTLQARDTHHLLRFGEFVGFKGQLKDRKKTLHPRTTLMFNDVKLTAALLNAGWMDYKLGINCRILEIIPLKLYNHFVRGYFDGDGCISSQKRKHRKKRRWYANIVCKYKPPLDVMLERMNIGCGTVKKRKDVYALVFANAARTEAFCSYIYHNQSICLKRKLNRYHEFLGVKPYEWSNINDFTFRQPLESIADLGSLRKEFSDLIVNDGWKTPKYDIDADLAMCKRIIAPIIKDEISITGKVHGNDIIAHFQPMIWKVRQRKASISELPHYPSLVAKAVDAFLQPGKNLGPARLVRELLFAGFTKASLLSTQAIMTAIKHFDLGGIWFDPCAGWGNRLLAASLLGIRYIATDPGVCYPGLLKISDYLRDNGFAYTNPVLMNQRWEDAIWPQCDFVLTSPPFYDKEDYLDGIRYASFDVWYGKFLKPLIDKSLSAIDKVILHVDLPMKTAIGSDFALDSISVIGTSRHKAPKEYFVRIKR